MAGYVFDAVLTPEEGSDRGVGASAMAEASPRRPGRPRAAATA